MMSLRVKDLRQQRGWSQWALATRAGTSPTMLCAIEKHGHVPGPDLQRRIAQALEVSVTDLWPEPAPEPAAVPPWWRRRGSR